MIIIQINNNPYQDNYYSIKIIIIRIKNIPYQDNYYSDQEQLLFR